MSKLNLNKTLIEEMIVVRIKTKKISLKRNVLETRLAKEYDPDRLFMFKQ